MMHFRLSAAIWSIAILAASFCVELAAAESGLPPKLSLQEALQSVSPEHPAVRFTADNQLANLLRGFSTCRPREAFREMESLPTSNCAYFNLLTPVQQQRFVVMRRFFDVVLADQRAGRDNEAMAVVFVELDRARSRMELGQYSDIDVMELEANYQEVLHHFRTSELLQRGARGSLAKAMASEQLPSDVIRPEISALIERQSPDVKKLSQAIISSNPLLNDLRNGKVTYGGDLEALISLVEGELRQTALELKLSLDALAVALEKARTRGDYRDLYLDRSRTLYELEVKADLGDAMVEQSDALLAQMKTEYEIAMVWAAIDALSGKSLTERENGQSDEEKK